MSQILWIGCLESDEEFKVKAKKGYDLASAQVSQKNLLLGIERVSGIIGDTINGSVLPPYPIYQDRIIKPVEWNHAENSFDISVGYKNDKYVNRIRCKNSMIKAADKWIEQRYKGGELVVFVYSMRSAPMATACRIKEKIPQAKIFLIVTDLPQFMDLGQSKFKSLLKKLDWISIKKMQDRFDGFILYAEKMAEYLQVPKEKWILMEGSYDVTESIDVCSVKKKAVMYSGKLDMQYGIKLLIDAFMMIDDPKAELWLTGGGNAEEYIKERAVKDMRIKYFGFLPSRQDVLKKQTEASLLVNMRLPSEAASAYCFPSKLFEYMATGIPVLSFNLAGIPEEYYSHLIIIDHESVSSVSQAIQSALNMPQNEASIFGQEAKSFIVENKTSDSQCKRILDFVNIQMEN